MEPPHDAVATPDAHAVSDHRRGNGESAEGKHGRNEEAKGPGVFSRDRSAVVDHHRRFVTGCRLLLSKRRGDAKREEGGGRWRRRYGGGHQGARIEESLRLAARRKGLGVRG